MHPCLSCASRAWRPTVAPVSARTLGLMERILIAATALAAGLSNAAPRIDPLLPTDIDFGCGCSFNLPGTGYAQAPTVLQWEFGLPANIRVDGRLRKLEVKELPRQTAANGPLKIGDKTTFVLHGRGVSVSAVCTFTEVCTPDRPSCEVNHFRAKLTVQSETGTSVLRTEGTCGC